MIALESSNTSFSLEAFRHKAQELGFAEVGVTPAAAPLGYAKLLDWLQLGYAADMHYFANRIEAYRDLSLVLQDTASVIVLAFPYSSKPAVAPESTEGRVASYAWGHIDYHHLLHRRMDQLILGLKEELQGHQFRGVVDSAPVMEREFAQAAGLGWAGKNSLLLNRKLGSYFFLCCILTTASIAADPEDDHHSFAESTSHCGNCTRCLDACPTDALVQPGVVDARRCISYLTIEHRGPIPTELRSQMGDWVFGCDICQTVCPWNRFAPQTSAEELFPRPDQNPIDLCELFALDDDAFRRRFRDTPLWRPRRRGLLRNAAICLGNNRSTDAKHALACGLVDSEALVRGAAAWALGQIGGSEAESLLRERLAIESNDVVLSEIRDALQQLTMTARPQT